MGKSQKSGIKLSPDMDLAGKSDETDKSQIFIEFGIFATSGSGRQANSPR